jgi:CHAT domain-containing protein
VSRYVGQKLNPEEAEAFEEHYFGCDRCWEEVQRATEVRAAFREAEAPAKAIPFRQRRRIPLALWGGLAAAAAVALVVATPILLRPRLGKHPVTELVAAIGKRRLVEPRLTGGFEYAPVRRSAASSWPSLSLEVLTAARKIEIAAERNSTPQSIGALGVARLLLGDASQAVSTLERAARLAPQDARLQSDLSAAYLVRARRENRPDDLPNGITAADRAIELDPRLAEAHFNRALALEAMSLESEAIEAWQRFLSLDGNSGWSEEARRHLRTAPQTPRSQLWRLERERLSQDVAMRDFDKARRSIARFPQETREYVERDLLGTWGNLNAALERTESAGVLALARFLSDGHFRATGDPLLSDSIKAIDRAIARGGRSELLSSLTAGHQAFREGRRLYDTLAFSEAAASFRQARTALIEGRSPFADWAAVYLSMTDYYAGRLDEAAADLGAIRKQAFRSGYLNLLGRASWVHGLIALQKGRFLKSLSLYQSALSCFEKTGEVENQAAVEFLLAENFDSLGEPREAWKHRVRALASIGFPENPRPRHSILVEASLASRSQERPWAALHFQVAALEAAERWSNPAALTEGHLYMASVRQELGHYDLAGEQLRLARLALHRVADPALAHRLEAEVVATEGELWHSERPVEAERCLTNAIDYFRAANSSSRLPELLLMRGRARVASGRRDLAESDFLEGIREFEGARSQQGPFRMSYFASAADLFDEMVQSRLERGVDPEESLAFIERGRSRDLLDTFVSLQQKPTAESGRPLDLTSIRQSLPERTALVYYALLRKQLLIWVMTSQKTDFFRQVVTSNEIDREVKAYRETLEVDSATSDGNGLASKLYDRLIRPLRGSLASIGSLVFVPDGILHAVPFAALRDGKTNRYLIEDYAVSSAPSGTLLALGLRGHRQQEIEETVLVLGNPRVNRTAFPNQPDLSGAEGEARQIAAMYPRATLLTGPAATKQAFLERMGEFEVVHLAVHAIAHPEAPDLSRFALASGPGHDDSGVLFAREIYGRPMPRTRLVVLAACGTASGAGVRGEGVISLARPFLAAAVPSVVATLWDVDDDAGLRLFAAFHSFVRKGAEPAAALRAAQLSLLKGDDTLLRSPARWAGAMLFGGSTG